MGDLGLGPLIELNRDAPVDRTPLFCIHPAGGLSWCYARLGRALDPPRRVYGLQARALDLDVPLPDPLDEIAADYARLVRSVQPISDLTKAGVMAFLRSADHPLGTLSDEVLTGIMRIVSHNSLLVRRHVHRRFEGDVTSFRAALDHQGTTLSPDEWAPYVGGRLDVHDVPSLHAHLMGPEATIAMARVLARRDFYPT